MHRCLRRTERRKSACLLPPQRRLPNLPYTHLDQACVMLIRRTQIGLLRVRKYLFDTFCRLWGLACRGTVLVVRVLSVRYSAAQVIEPPLLYTDLLDRPEKKRYVSHGT